jgi:ribosome biogenesis GTPase A
VDDPKLFLSPPLIDMADQRPPQTAKESKGFRKYLKLFRRGSQSTPPPVSTITRTTDPKLEEAAKLRAKYSHFRILVIGRANAGKTTLLKRVCNSKEDPVYSKVRYPLRLILHSHRPFTNR